VRSGLQLDDLAPCLVALDPVSQNRLEFVRLPRFSNVAADLAPVDGIDGVGQIRVGGDQDPHRVRIQILGRLKDLDTAHSGHALVNQQHRHFLLLEDLQGFWPARRGDHVELVGAGRFQHHQVGVVVVHVEYGV